MILDLIGFVAAFAAVFLVLGAIYAGHRTGATLRRLTLAVQLWRWAVLAAFVNLAANAFDIPNDGPFGVVVPTIILVMNLICAVKAEQVRDKKGAEVQAEAERMVREWNGGAK